MTFAPRLGRSSHAEIPLSRAGSAYKASKQIRAAMFTSFCGSPVRRPASTGRKPKSRWLHISSIPPMYEGLRLSRKRSVAGGVAVDALVVPGRNPMATRVSKNHVRTSGEDQDVPARASRFAGFFASSVKTSISTALRSTLDRPECKASLKILLLGSGCVAAVCIVGLSYTRRNLCLRPAQCGKSRSHIAQPLEPYLRATERSTSSVARDQELRHRRNCSRCRILNTWIMSASPSSIKVSR